MNGLMHLVELTSSTRPNPPMPRMATGTRSSNRMFCRKEVEPSTDAIPALRFAATPVGKKGEKFVNPDLESDLTDVELSSIDTCDALEARFSPVAPKKSSTSVAGDWLPMMRSQVKMNNPKIKTI